MKPPPYNCLTYRIDEILKIIDRVPRRILYVPLMFFLFQTLIKDDSVRHRIIGVIAVVLLCFTSPVRAESQICAPTCLKEHKSFEKKQTFPVSCPRILNIIPLFFIKNQVNWPLSSLILSPEMHGCFLKILLDKQKISPSDASLLTMLFSTPGIFHYKDRPDIQAYFYQNSAANGDRIAMKALAKLYEHGKGVPLDREKAKHMFREANIIYFPRHITGQECIKSIRKEHQSSTIVDNDQRTDLEKEQFQWLETLCTQDTETLFLLANEYMNPENPYRSRTIALALWSHLSRARHDGKALKYYLETPEHPINSGL